MDQYNSLNKAQLSFEYLHTNSTTHTFLFGALAELVDNSRDAGATNLDIYTCNDPFIRGGFYLSFLDDGCGMNYDDVFNIIVFGKSLKHHNLDSNQIGQYGNGLKSGAMRIANDLILFTKKDHIGTCLFLSRTFHQEENISQIICPMPCFDLNIQQPLDNQDIYGTYTYIYDQIKHELEMKLIFKYSPFKTIEDLFKQFNLIKTLNGTLIILYNMKLLDTGDTELDIKTDPYDILIDSNNRYNLFNNNDESIPLEYRSFRAYVSILYDEPRMRIRIQQKRVITKKLSYTLYKPRQYQFKSTRFKIRFEQEIKQYEKEFQSLEERIHESNSQIYDIQQKLGIITSIDERIKLRKLQMNSIELKDLAHRLQNTIANKKFEINSSQILTFIFGFNIENRAADGIFIYNCGRLIKMYEKLGQSNKKTLYCRGIIGIINIPSIVLEPTHNKQSFANEKEYHFLLKNIGEFMRQYWTDTGIEYYIKEFWETYGYRDDQLDRLPSNDPEIVQRRQVAVPMLIQCDQCLKWRRLPYSTNGISLTQSQLESWQCIDNTDLLNNSCLINEKLEIIPEGELKPKLQTHATLPITIRPVANNKHIFNTGISTMTISPISTRSSSNVGLLSSTISQKCSTPPSRSVSAKEKSKNKRKRSISKAKHHDTTNDEEKESFSTYIRTSSSNRVYTIDDDNTENINYTEMNSNGLLPPPTIGARVWAMYQGARRAGKVLSVNDKRGIFKMRFDDFPTAEFDYSFEYNSPVWSYIEAPPPTSTDMMITSVKTSDNENEPLFTIAKKFKTLIKFMLPPNWKLTREQISSMTYNDLSQFDISVFMQSYREKMAKIVEQRKADEAHWRTSTQRLQTEVTELLNISGMPIPNDCSMEDFEQHVQTYKKMV